jgi:hypothetical protein
VAQEEGKGEKSASYTYSGIRFPPLSSDSSDIIGGHEV